jgi:hypothetical protein
MFWVNLLNWVFSMQIGGGKKKGKKKRSHLALHLNGKRPKMAEGRKRRNVAFLELEIGPNCVEWGQKTFGGHKHKNIIIF